MESRREHRRRAGCRRALSAVSIAMLLLAVTAPLGAGARPEDSDSLSPFVLGSLEKTLSDVLARVASDRCRRIFSDFQDARGRPRDSVLHGLHVTPRSYLAAVRFPSGLGPRTCADSRIVTFSC